MDERCLELIPIALDHKPRVLDLVSCSFVLYGQHEASSQNVGVYWNLFLRTIIQIQRFIRPWVYFFLASVNFSALWSMDLITSVMSV